LWSTGTLAGLQVENRQNVGSIRMMRQECLVIIIPEVRRGPRGVARIAAPESLVVCAIPSFDPNSLILGSSQVFRQQDCLGDLTHGFSSLAALTLHAAVCVFFGQLEVTLEHAFCAVKKLARFQAVG
jgi:hypothetical protein